MNDINIRIIAIAKAVENTAKAIEIASTSIRAISNELVDLQKDISKPTVVLLNPVATALAKELNNKDE